MFVLKTTHLDFDSKKEDTLLGDGEYILERFDALHRRIVVCSRLRLLGSAYSLLWAVSLRQKRY